MTDLDVQGKLEEARSQRDELDRLIAWLESSPLLTDAQPVTAAPSPSPPRPARRSSRDAEATVLSIVLKSGHPLKRSEIAEAAGQSDHTVGRILKGLVDSGKVVKEGATKSLRYRANRDHKAHSVAGQRTKDAIERAGKAADDAVSRVGLRDRVLRTITREPHSEDQLTVALLADREDIAEACGWLLERDRVTLQPDGTYVPQ